MRRLLRLFISDCLYCCSSYYADVDLVITDVGEGTGFAPPATTFAAYR